MEGLFPVHTSRAMYVGVLVACASTLAHLPGDHAFCWHKVQLVFGYRLAKLGVTSTFMFSVTATLHEFLLMILILQILLTYFPFKKLKAIFKL